MARRRGALRWRALLLGAGALALGVLVAGCAGDSGGADDETAVATSVTTTAPPATTSSSSTTTAPPVTTSTELPASTTTAPPVTTSTELPASTTTAPPATTSPSSTTTAPPATTTTAPPATTTTELPASTTTAPPATTTTSTVPLTTTTAARTRTTVAPPRRTVPPPRPRTTTTTVPTDVCGRRVSGSSPARAVPVSGELSWSVVRRFPHDVSRFTQGLLVADGGFVVESTGLRGQSAVYTYCLADGRLLDQVRGDDQHFGEGIAAIGDRLVWLTWQAEVASELTVDEATGELATTDTEFSYSGEGWGLCFDGRRLVMSDGSATLEFRDAQTFAVLGSVEVVDADGEPVARLNELECVAGQVWANVWLTDRIVVIDPSSGAVVAETDMSGLVDPHPSTSNSNAVLNGIAYRADTGTFLVTGKLWPTTFEVSFGGS